MIYLIEIGALDKNRNPIRLLKLGYTENIKDRFTSYECYCQGCVLLYTIPDCTEEDEKKLHKYFKKYRYIGKEWYSYENEILEFFNTHTTRNSILSVIDSIKLKISAGVISRKTKEAYLKYAPLIIETFNYDNLNPEKYKKLNEIKGRIRHFISGGYDDVLSYLKTEYPGVDFDKEITLGDEEKKIIEDINNIDIFCNRMKYIYNLGMSEDIAKVVLSNLDDIDYEKYYWSISKTKAGSLNYQKGKLEEEYNKLDRNNKLLLSRDNISNEIYSTFSPGNKYLKSDIKDKLQEIFDKTGISRTAKAVDLEEYFELKSCKVTNKKTGIRDNAFKIIKRK